MEPELSPEPEESRPKTTETIRYGKEQEEEMLRQVAEDSKRQGEADHEREEGEMLGRVLKKAREGEEPKKQEKKGEVELGRKPKSEEEGKRERRVGAGLCDLCKDTEKNAGGKGEPGDCKGKEIERSDWGEEGWREAGIQITAEDPGETVKGTTRVLGQTAGGTREQGKKEEDKILINAPKGPKRLPRFYNLCRIYGHNDLTCHLQGNAPTPGPSRYQKPFKTLQQRTPRRGLGAPRGRLDIPTKKGELELELKPKSGSGKKVNRGIIFKKEEEPAPPKRKTELELEPTKSDAEPKNTGLSPELESELELELKLELELAEKKEEEGEEKKESGGDHLGEAEPEPEAKGKKEKGTEREPSAEKPKKGKQRE